MLLLAISTLVWGQTFSLNERSALKTILNHAAIYCEKLKSAVFRYFCEEEIVETITNLKGKSSQNAYTYDYQIIGNKGKFKEKRNLILDNGKKVNKKNQKVKSNVYSFYSVFSPIVLFSRENQKAYFYQLLGEEEIDGIMTVKLKVEPRTNRKEYMRGEIIWLDKSDYSILKIEMDPVNFKSFENLQSQAEKLKANLELIDIHWYGEKVKGIRFPSKTEIREIYHRPENPFKGIGSDYQHIYTIFVFRNYRFFEVSVNKIEAKSVDIEVK